MYKFEKSLASKRQWPGSHAKNTIKNGHIMLEFEFWNFTPTKTQRTALVHRRLDASLSTRIRLKQRQGKDCMSFTSHLTLAQSHTGTPPEFRAHANGARLHSYAQNHDSIAL